MMQAVWLVLMIAPQIFPLRDVTIDQYIMNDLVRLVVLQLEPAIQSMVLFIRLIRPIRIRQTLGQQRIRSSEFSRDFKNHHLVAFGASNEIFDNDGFYPSPVFDFGSGAST